MSTTPNFPLSAASRIAVGLHILKCGLMPRLSAQLNAAHIDPLEKLPPSSPVRKHGFELDIRAGLILIRDHISTLAPGADEQAIRGAVRKILKTRDRWAHQQDISQTEATDWLRVSVDLANAFDRTPTARSLSALTNASERETLAAALILTPLIKDSSDEERTPMLSFTSFAEHMDMALYGANPETAFRALTWYSARQHLLGETPVAALIVLGSEDVSNKAEAGMMGQGFWWTLGLAYDAPFEIRKNAHEEALNTLDEARHAAYPKSHDL